MNKTMEQLDLMMNGDMNIIEIEEIEEVEVETNEDFSSKPTEHQNRRMIIIHKYRTEDPDREYVSFEEDSANKIKAKDIVEEAMEDLFADSDLEDGLLPEEHPPPEDPLLSHRLGTKLQERNDKVRVKLKNSEPSTNPLKPRPGCRRVTNFSEKSTIERQMKESEQFRATLERRPVKGELKDLATFEEHQKVMAKRKEGYSCVACPVISSNRRALNQHLKTHSVDGASFQCPECHRTFNQSCNLRRHMRRHSGERPFKCGVCGKQFSDQGYLTTHARYHSDERPYVCVICAKEFIDRSNYVKHMKCHSGDRQHRCQVCPKAFVQLSDLTRHARVHSGERPYACDQCDRCYQQPGDLAQHKRQHSGERPYSCSKCGRTFANKRYLLGHERLRVCTKPKVVRPPKSPKTESCGTEILGPE